MANGVNPMAPSPANLIEYLKGMTSRGYSQGTVGRRLAALRGFFARLVAVGRLATSPLEDPAFRRAAIALLKGPATGQM